MTYGLMKKLIENGKNSEENIMKKLDVFLIADRINEEQYKELVNLIKDTENKTA